MTQIIFNDKPLISFCFNETGDIWDQDMWNNQIFNRTYDVLAQRTNQIQPFPESTSNELCFKRIQNLQNQLNPYCNDLNYTRPIEPNDNYDIKSIYNTHYQLAPKQHQMVNLRNTENESELWTLGRPWTKDCPSQAEIQELRACRLDSNRELYRQFHKEEVNSSCYPNADRHMFHNTTKEIYNSVDNRNQFGGF